MKLYRLENGIGSYWVVANDPTEAEEKLMDKLNKGGIRGEGYGFSSQRIVTSIHLIAECMFKDDGEKFDCSKKLLL